eukprot:COSAG02_NODE_772_length_17359_cov_74.661587_12_plen_86_part_00
MRPYLPTVRVRSYGSERLKALQQAVLERRHQVRECREFALAASLFVRLRQAQIDLVERSLVLRVCLQQNCAHQECVRASEPEKFG